MVEKVGDIDPQQTPNDTENSGTSINNNNVFKKYFLLILLLLTFSATGIFIWKLVFQKPISKDSAILEYTNGLPKDRVVVHMPHDEVIERYPVLDFTIAGFNVYINTFEGLTVYRGTNNLQPGLAESWTNPDPRTWRIKLRKGVRFHSGDSFSAKDVKFTIEEAKKSENDARPWMSQTMASRVETVKIIDDYTVDLITKEPDATLISWMVYVGIVSEAQVKRDGLSKAVGTGPYKLLTLSEREATLEAYKEYWDGAPKVNKLVYKVIYDPALAVNALKNGEVDIIWLSSTLENNFFGKNFYTTIYYTGGVDNYIGFDLNSPKTKYIDSAKNPFADSRVRKAISLGLDKSKLITQVGINAEPLSQFGTRELIGYNSNLKVSDRDVEEAKKLLTEAGFPEGFTVTFHTDQQTDNVKVANELKKQLSEIGINLNIEIPETDILYEMIDKSDFSMLLSFYYPDTLDSIDLLDTLFHTPGGSHGLWNVNKYSNPALDSTISNAVSTFDTDKRITYTHKAHELVMSELPSIPLYTKKYQIISRNDLTFQASINMILSGINISGREVVK